MRHCDPACRQAGLREINNMKILTPSQLYEADRLTIEKEGITSWQLMERASLSAVDSIRNLTKKEAKICVLAGIGNNGGDGLAIAYHLHTSGYHVEVVILKYAESYSKDCQINLDRLKNETEVDIKILQDDKIDFSTPTVFIDAVFGIGLNRKMPDFVEEIIKSVNHFNAFKIAIDVPSGLFLSSLTPEDAVVFKADHTLTFQCPKLHFFLPHFGNCVGKVTIIDIGLDKRFIEKSQTSNFYADRRFVKLLLQPRERFTHKGTYGHVLLVGGQKGMMGCMVLSSKSAIRSGAGKVSTVVPKCGIDILQSSSPEVMVIPSHKANHISEVEIPFEPSVIGIGMGIGQSQDAEAALIFFLNHTKKPMLIDADGLNIIANHKDLLKKLPSKSILTPHQGELARLIGQWSDDLDKIEKLKTFSADHDLILVSKDAYTFVVYNDEIYINSTGNAGMATAGTGDVLSGLIAGLLAQGYTPLNASILGVHIHGLSGDIYASNYEQNTLIASEVIENFKAAFSLLKK